MPGPNLKGMNVEALMSLRRPSTFLVIVLGSESRKVTPPMNRPLMPWSSRLICNDVLWTFDWNAKGKRNSRRLGLPILAEYSSRLYALAFG
jgi:hypothetical protein